MGRETNKQRRARQAATAREKAAQSRAAQRQSEQRRRAMAIIGSVVAVAAVLAVVAVLAITAKPKHQTNDRTAASSPILNSVTSVSPAALQTVGPGSAELLAKPTSGDPPLTQNGKPELLFVGGEFCPICAAERWSMVQALSRFGKFSNLGQIRSASDDGNIATFTFYKSNYASKYLSFDPVEAEDRNQKQLEKLTPAQGKIFSKYTTGFPFLYFGGKYYQTSAGYDPTTLSGLDWQQISEDLKNPSSDVAKGILGEANNLTATICRMTNDQPSKVCLAPEITTLESHLSA